MKKNLNLSNSKDFFRKKVTLQYFNNAKTHRYVNISMAFCTMLEKRFRY